ncbi:MAG: hypothetical protein AABO58_15205 [Acidobacteriota bacterium]
MYSKSLLIATCALAVCAGCVSVPWRNEPVGNEVNLAFSLEKNLLVVTSATIQGRPGRFVFGSAAPRTVVDATFAQSLPRGRRLSLQIGEKQSLGFSPLFADLRGVGDAMLGADVWGSRAVTVDYHAGVITYQKEGIHPESMTVYRFTGAPKINVDVDGRTFSAIVDTASPDTLVLPRGSESAHRAKARLRVGGVDFGMVDLAIGDVTTARVGNRVLSKFLVTIDYGRRQVGLWRDPRTPI